MPELLGDQRFASSSARRKNNGLLKISSKMARFVDQERMPAALEGQRIPAAPVLDLSEVMSSST